MLTQVFSHSDLVTDSEQFYNSILKLLQDQNESEEVDLLFLWWNRQIFPLYTKSERLPSKNSVKWIFYLSCTSPGMQHVRLLASALGELG